MSERRILIAGLGNPGARYAGNRHNIGFMAVDALAHAYRAPDWRSRFHAACAETAIKDVRVLLVKPQTFMNESGRAVAEAAKFFKIALDDIIVFHDELDLAPARLRMKKGGGDAGHNGLRSITAHLGPDYRRARMGIGHPGDKALVHSYVLNDFAKAELPWVEDLCHAVSQSAGWLAAGKDERFQSDVALAMNTKGHADVKRIGT